MPKPKKYIIGVLGCPIRKNKKGQIEYFLTQRYAPKFKKVHLAWQLAGGGLEFGEEPEETLVREFQEELDITPDILYPHPITAKGLRTDNANYRFDLHIILLAYLVSMGDQNPKIIDPDEETSDMGWFSFDEIQKLKNIENNLYFIRQFQKIIKKENLI